MKSTARPSIHDGDAFESQAASTASVSSRANTVKANNRNVRYLAPLIIMEGTECGAYDWRYAARFEKHRLEFETLDMSHIWYIT